MREVSHRPRRVRKRYRRCDPRSLTPEPTAEGRPEPKKTPKIARKSENFRKLPKTGNPPFTATAKRKEAEERSDDTNRRGRAAQRARTRRGKGRRPRSAAETPPEKAEHKGRPH